MPATLAGVPLDRLILEITEHETVAHYSRLNRALDPMRSQGLRVAVDDMGAGYSSLRHILQIRPDLIKLDMSLCSGIDKDPARRALASALISFSREIDSQLVAEGVETEEERDVLRSLGVNLVQGFLLGRPSTLGEQKGLLGYSLRTAGPSDKRSQAAKGASESRDASERLKLPLPCR